MAKLKGVSKKNAKTARGGIDAPTSGGTTSGGTSGGTSSSGQCVPTTTTTTDGRTVRITKCSH